MSGEAARMVGEHSGLILTLVLLILPLVVCAAVARMPRRGWAGTLAGIAAGYATAFVIGIFTDNGAVW